MRDGSEALVLIETAIELTRRPGDRSRLSEAVSLYRRAYRLGSTWASYNLACTYQNVGEHRLAVRWFRRTLEAGDLSALLPLAQAELGGVGTRRDPAAAMEKLERVARRSLVHAVRSRTGDGDRRSMPPRRLGGPTRLSSRFAMAPACRAPGKCGGPRAPR